MELAAMRKSRNLTQAQLAKNIGLKRSTICNYEKNYRAPSTDTLIKLAALYNVTLDELVRGTPIPAVPSLPSTPTTTPAQANRRAETQATLSEETSAHSKPLVEISEAATWGSLREMIRRQNT